MRTVLLRPHQPAALCAAQAWRSTATDIMVCRDAGRRPFSAWRPMPCLDSPQLFARLGDPALSGLVRQNAGGTHPAHQRPVRPPWRAPGATCASCSLTEVLTLALGQRVHLRPLLSRWKAAASGLRPRELLAPPGLPAHRRRTAMTAGRGHALPHRPHPQRGHGGQGALQLLRLVCCPPSPPLTGGCRRR